MRNSSAARAAVDKNPIGLDLNKIRALRKQRQWTQSHAAERAGMTVARWNDIESGRRPNVTVSTLDRIARALAVAPQDLLKSRPG